MTKFLRAKKSKYFEFSLLDETIEYRESFDIVFEKRNTLYFVFNEYSKKYDEQQIENIKYHVIDSYVNQRGWGKVIFLKEV